MSKEKEALLKRVNKMAAVLQAARKISEELEIEKEATEETGKALPARPVPQRLS